jgi:mannose-6-phosphate isomerase-like protein (cupin superfamily)
MQGIKIQPLYKIGENEKGATFSFDNPCRNGDLVCGYRKAGSISGRHYHEGKTHQKNPEIFIILNGEAELYAKNLNTAEEIRETIKEPSFIEIYPFVWHEVKALTDFVFIELNTMQQHADDTKYEMDEIINI